MDDAGCMGSGQGGTCLVGDVQELRQGKTAPICQALLEGHPFQKLHEDVGRAVGGPPSVEDIDDVGMPDSTGSACFVKKPADQLGVSRKLRVQDFDGSSPLD